LGRNEGIIQLVPPGSIQNSRKEFKQKIEGLQHFPDSYTGYKELEGKIKREIDLILDL
jgi:hypothetical protein